MFGRLISALVLAVTAALFAIGAPAGAAPPTPLPPKIMLYGDSITQSFNSDWTWRYRLWQSLQESDAKFDFVGPRNDVLEYTISQQDSQGYRQANFDRDHASMGGMRFLSGPYQIAPLARTYRPNVVVALIGLNDLRVGSSVADLEQHWRQQIAQARLYDRGVDIVLVQLPHTWIANVPAYDDMLVRLAGQLDTPDERVITTDRPAFDVWSDVFDYLHLSSVGQAKMSAVVAPALAKLGIGTGQPATTPDPPDDHTWAPVPAASVDGTTVTLTWPGVTYASHEHVFIRDTDTGVTGIQRFVKGTSTTFAATAGHTYSVWLAPVRGYLPIGTTSLPITIDVPAA